MISLNGKLTPAFERIFNSGNEALAAWNRGIFFRITNHRYNMLITIADTKGEPDGHILQLQWSKRLVSTRTIRKRSNGLYEWA